MNRPIHFEICADDPEKSAAFYTQVFGWDCKLWEGPQEYRVLTTGPDSQPGINGAMNRNQMGQRVVNTVSVESLAETAAKVEAGGGKKIHGPFEIPGVGLHAYYADPEGVLFGLLQPAKPE